MEIHLEAVGRKYVSNWLFKDITFAFNTEGHPYAILGPNGSGKSTLLSLISGYLSPSKGLITFKKDGVSVEKEQRYNFVSMVAPYLELIEEFTLEEMIDFHFKFNTYTEGIDKSILLKKIQLEKHKDKEIRYFSSGMKQRAKLGLSLFSRKPLLLLDEPTVNLDKEGVKWYQELMLEQINNKLVIIASNASKEYEFAQTTIDITDYI